MGETQTLLMTASSSTPKKVKLQRKKLSQKRTHSFPILFQIRDVFYYTNIFMKAQLSFAQILQVSSDCSNETQEAHTSKHINKDLALSYFLTHPSDKTLLSLDFTHALKRY